MNDSPLRKPSSDAPLWIGFGLVVLVMAVYGQTLRHEFLYYDDGHYITDNPMVRQGLTWAGVRWSLTAVVAHMWHPLTLISHMLDVSLFGMQPGLHHLVNVILHAANAVLMFLVFWRMTGDLWKPAIVAAIWAVHPLRAESVAWASERKDVLSALFFFLALLAYARYAETRRLRDYALVFGSFALGLCAKPMLVTFPFVLLLLDFWPLKRVQVPGATEGRQRFRALLLEKIPLFGLTIAGAVVTIWSQHSSGATRSIEAIPIAVRIANAIHSYGIYLYQTAAPYKLAVMYPHPGSEIAWGITIVILLGLLGFTLLLLRDWQQFPAFLMGWCWFLGMLVPVIGIVQVGGMAHSDRYTYLPQVGLLIGFVYSMGWRLEQRPAWHTRILLVSAALSLFAFTMQGYAQVALWRNQITLFKHTVEVSPGSSLAHFNLGNGYAFSGRPDLAEPHFRESLRINSRELGAKTNLAGALIELGRPQEAVPLLQELIDFDPYEPEYQVQLALALYRQGKYGEALFRATEALRIDPEYQRALHLADQCRKALAPEVGGQ